MKKIFLALTMLLGLGSTVLVEKATADDVVFVPIFNNDDWDNFCNEVEKAKGKYWVDARLEADLTVSSYAGRGTAAPYRGTFDGNGHTLNVNISRSDNASCALFSYVGSVTIKDLHLTGTVSGGIHSAGLVGYAVDGASTITVNRVWVSTDVTASATHAGGIIGHSNRADVYMNDCRFDGSITTNNLNNSSYAGCIIGWCNGGGWTMHRVYNCYTSATAWRIWFSVDYNANTGATNAWGSNGKSSLTITNTAWGDWRVSYYNKNDQNEVVNLMNAERGDSWGLVDGKAAPKMNSTSLAADWKELSEGSSSGYTLSSGKYYITKDIEFSNNNAGGSGLSISGVVHIYIPKGVTLTARGAGGSGRTGGGAGIHLPNGSTLYLEGGGKVIATGGDAADGERGGNGTDGYFDGSSMYAGKGGYGGAGGGGAGAGIGTPGGTGAGRQSGTGSNSCSYLGSATGITGNGGNSGSTAAAMGTLFVYSPGIQVQATGGSKGSGGGGGYPGGCLEQCAWEFNSVASGGGGGGGGAGGGHAEGIGTGGAGGGSGGSGAAGSCTSAGDSLQNEPEDFYNAWAGGGSGGKGSDYNGGQSGRKAEKTTTTWGSAKNYEYLGRDGGSGGSAGDGSVSHDTDYDYVIQYNVLDRFGGKVMNTAKAGYNSNSDSEHIMVIIPPTYTLGLVQVDHYVSRWYTNEHGNGSSKGAYDGHYIGKGVTHLYGVWNNYSDIFPVGYGTKSKPFIIEGGDLLELADYVNEGGNTRNVYFKQKGDILASYILERNNRGKNWTPIGHTRPFEGDYDGGGKLIRKVTIDKPDYDAVGIFGKVLGSIHNLGAEDVTINSSRENARCGAIAGLLYGDTELQISGRMSNCYAARNTISGAYAGGLVGQMTDNAFMTHCHGYKNNVQSTVAGGGITSQIIDKAKAELCFTTEPEISRKGGLTNTSNCERGVTEKRMASGELTWTLNDKTGFGTVWFQDIDTETNHDAYPVLDSISSPVFTDGTNYSNNSLGTLFAFKGKGTRVDPFLINSKEDLEKVANYCNLGNKSSAVYFLQTADIDLNGQEIAPIGNTQKYAFDGIYDGGGHAIRNGKIKDNTFAGVFGVVTGKVNRLQVEKLTINYEKRDGRSGGIAARLKGQGEISNCFVKECTVMNNGTQGYDGQGVAGGIASDMFDQSVIRNCLVLKTTMKATRTGYICSDTKIDTKIVRCYTDGAYLTSYDNQGASTDSYTSVSERTLTSGEVCYELNNRDNLNPEPVWYQNISETSVRDSIPVLSSDHAMVFSRDGNYTNDAVDIGRLGKGTQENPYKIATPKDLQDLVLTIGLQKRSNFYILQTADIDMKDSLMVPIGTCTAGFAGHYDGGGHVIRNIEMQNYQGESMGLFNNISGIVERLGIENSTFVADDKITRVGAFAGKLTGKGQLRNCYVKGSRMDINNMPGVVVGALVGEQADTTRMECCYGYKNEVTGQNDNLKHYGYIVGYIGSSATGSLVFTDGPTLCADKQPGAKNIVQSERAVSDFRFNSGEVSWLLSGSKDYSTAWRQTIRTDSTPVLNTSHPLVYRRECGRQALYINNDEEAYTATLTLDPNHDGQAASTVEVLRADDRYYVPEFDLLPYAVEQTNYDFAGWCTDKDGKGTFYPSNGKLLPKDNLKLYAIWDIKVPSVISLSGRPKIVSLAELRSDTLLYKVYDDGGSNSPYGYNYNGKVLLKAPAGHYLCLTGTVATEAPDGDGKPRDYMKVYEDDPRHGTVELTNEKDESVFCSKTDGAKEDIGKIMSSGEEMIIEFVSDDENCYDGLDLLVTVLPKVLREMGQGTESDPFLVETLEELKAIDEYIRVTGDSKVYIEQIEHIDMAGETFTPLASNVGSFEGHYDGGGYEIRNMKMDAVRGQAVGLFHNVSGVVERLGMVNCTLKGVADDACVGTIAGKLSGSGKVRYCYALNNSVANNGTSGVAGALVGEQTDRSHVESCYSYHNAVSGHTDSNSNIVGRVSGNATQNLLFTDGAGTDLFAFRTGEICHALNSVMPDDNIWRQTIGTDSLPMMETEEEPREIVYEYAGEGVKGYTNDANPTLLRSELVDVVTNDSVLVYAVKNSLINLGEIHINHKHFVYHGWNTKADGSGDFYPKDTVMLYSEELKLYTHSDMVVNMAKDDSEKISVDIPKAIPFAKVFDDGGSDSTYTAGTRYVTLIAPEGSVLQLKGSVAAKAAEGAGTPADYLAVYDGNYSANLKDSWKLANGSAMSGEGWKYLYGSTTAGEPYDVGTLSSSGREMTIVFHTTGQDDTAYPGLDLTVTPVPVETAVSDLGKGTEEEPYQVMTAADLKKLGAYGKKTGVNDFSVRQTADIDMEGLPMEPLFGGSQAFNGYYDGDGHSISNMTIDGYSGTTVGLFGTVSGSVKRLGLENCTVKSSTNDARVGVLAGLLTGSGALSYSYVKGSTVTAYGDNSTAGALAGEMTDKSSIVSCYGFQNEFSVRPVGSGISHYGHIAGDMGSEATQRLVVTDGLYFCTDRPGEQGKIDMAFNRMSAASFASGEVCFILNELRSGGANWRQTLGSDGTPVTNDSHGVVYRYPLNQEFAFSNNAEAGTVTLHLANVLDSNGDKDVEVIAGSIKSLASLKMELERFDLTGWNTNPDGTGTAYALDGSVMMNEELTLYAQWNAASPFQVATAADLKALAEYICLTGNSELTVEQVADIDLTNVTMKPVGHIHPFRGTYDGGGHIIRNGVISAPAAAGVFGNVAGEVKCLAVENMTITAEEQDGRAGGIAAYLVGEGKILDCSVTGSKVSCAGIGIAGGIVADIYDQAVVGNCMAYNNTVRATRTGHICSDTKEGTAIHHCYTNGDHLVSQEARGMTAYCEYAPMLQETDFKSGKVCFQLNNFQSENTVWRQIIGTDELPVPDKSHATVYCHQTGQTPQKLFSNSQEQPETVTITLDYNDGSGHVEVITALLQHSEDETDLAFPLYRGLRPKDDGSQVVKWTSRSDGQGTSYQPDDMIQPFDNITLYAQWGFAIYNRQDFLDYGEKRGNLYLMQDIDLGEWNRDNDFTLEGHFDGGGHTIRYSSQSDCRGLFKTVEEDASVRHLRVEANIYTSKDCGGIACNNYGNISDCHFSGTIRENGSGWWHNYIAGIAVNVKYGGTIDHCSVTGYIQESEDAYHITDPDRANENYWTWIDPNNHSQYASLRGTAMSMLADYPVYAKGILDVVGPEIVVGDNTIEAVNSHVNSLTIVDGERFSCPTEVTADQITYQRQGTNNAYEPWVLPFDYTIDESMLNEGDVKFYRFVKDIYGNIQTREISSDEPYQVSANEPLAFQAPGDQTYSFDMKLMKDGTSQPMTIRIPADRVAASIASKNDMARVVASYEGVTPDVAAAEMMYFWDNDQDDFVLADGERDLQPFRYYLQYINKATGAFEKYEDTDWASMQTSGASARSLAQRRVARRSPLSTLTDEGWQPIILDPRGSQEVTAKMLEDYDILGLWDLYDEESAPGTSDNSFAVSVIYVPVEAGTTLPVAVPLLVRAKHANAEPLVTEQMGREIDALLTEAAENMSEEEVMEAFEEIHYWCSTFGGRYDVWQFALPEKDSLLNEYGALAFTGNAADQSFYRVPASDGASMKPMSYCFTAYDARTFENLPLANNRIEIVVLDLAELTDIEAVDPSRAQDGSSDAYNLQGQKVDDSYHGVIIRNGRKVLKK